MTLVRKVDVRLPGKGNSNAHGARPVHQIIWMVKWIRTSRMAIRTLSLFMTLVYGAGWDGWGGQGSCRVVGTPWVSGGGFRIYRPIRWGGQGSCRVIGTPMCCGTEAGSYLRLIDSCITQPKAQGPSRTCNESNEEEALVRRPQPARNSNCGKG